MESFQAGLSWYTILKKRKNFRKAFDNFEYKTIAKYNNAKIEELLSNEGIIRNRLKIKSSISNAQNFIQIQKEFGSFSHYIWSFTNHKVIDHQPASLADIPSKTELSDKIANDLKKRGFKFMGTTVVYAFLQATGIINDHLMDCRSRK